MIEVSVPFKRTFYKRSSPAPFQGITQIVISETSEKTVKKITQHVLYLRQLNPVLHLHV